MATTAANTIPIFSDLALRGIGASTASYLATNRVKIVVNGRDEEALTRTVD